MEKESLLTMLARHLFGRKYYANIVVSAGSFDYGISNYIFRNKEEADRHKEALEKIAHLITWRLSASAAGTRTTKTISINNEIKGHFSQTTLR